MSMKVPVCFVAYMSCLPHENVLITPHDNYLYLFRWSDVLL